MESLEFSERTVVEIFKGSEEAVMGSPFPSFLQIYPAALRLGARVGRKWTSMWSLISSNHFLRAFVSSHGALSTTRLTFLPLRLRCICSMNVVKVPVWYRSTNRK